MIKKLAKKLARYFICKINPDFLERALALSLLKNKYSKCKMTKFYSKREYMWDEAISQCKGNDVDFIEFGVFKEGSQVSWLFESN